MDDLPNGLENGQLVEVKGTFDTATETITATKVEAEDDLVADTDEFELEGIITDYINDSNFKIGDITVDASNASREPISLILDNDAHIEVEGAIVNGILMATEVESEGGDIKVHAMVTSVDLATNTFTVEPVSGQPVITVSVTSGTQLEDDVNEVEPFTLNNLVVDDFVEVRGFDDGDGGITAVEVDVKEQSDIVLQGYATEATGDATNGGTITVLGVVFSFDDMTDFEDENDENMDDTLINSLINAIPSTPKLVKIEDKQITDQVNPPGTADAIDIESP